MRSRAAFTAVAVPLMLILAGFAFYEYVWLRVEAQTQAARDMAAVKARTVEKYVALIAQKPAIEKRLEALREQRKAEEGRLITGQTPALAAAALQNSVKGLITSHGGKISSERVEKPEDRGSFKLITVSLDASFPGTKALSDTLSAIETHTPWLAIQEFDTRVKNIRDPKELTVRLRVSALTGVR
jgi:hypothetical protein